MCSEQAGTVSPASCWCAWLLPVCRMAAFEVQRGAETLDPTGFLLSLCPEHPGQASGKKHGFSHPSEPQEVTSQGDDGA